MLIAPMHAGLGGLHRIVLVVHRRGRACQIVDLVHLDIERKGDVVAHRLEMRIVQQVRDVVLAAGEVIVDAQHVVAVRNSRSHRCEPRKPAPPVTRTRLLISANLIAFPGAPK